MIHGIMRRVKTYGGCVAFTNLDFHQIGIQNRTVLHGREIYDAYSVHGRRPHHKHVVKTDSVCKIDCGTLASDTCFGYAHRFVVFRSSVVRHEHTALSCDLHE